MVIRVKKCPNCGIKVQIVEENHPLKHVCTECGGRGVRIIRDPRTKKREISTVKEEDKPLNYKEYSKSNRRT